MFSLQGLSLIDHLCINPILYRFALAQVKYTCWCFTNKVLCHCHSWLARQYNTVKFKQQDLSSLAI